ncbi:hypothetical protein AX15_002741 [Amanita polypyramis BW_CC]|nr:hypothetical protein AX15_002741 [Amanita polypyramis BW_CC]
MANSRIQAPQVNLKERIAALEQRNVTPNSPRSASSKPSGIPQLTSNNALRDKIAKFEKKGGIPVPRGRFGMGAPPVDSGKQRKQGEFYANRIPRAVSGGAPKTGPGSQAGKRSMSLSVHGYGHSDSDVSTPPRSASPCTTDYDVAYDGLLSPDAMETAFSQTLGSYDSPVSKRADAQVTPCSEASSLHVTQGDEETLDLFPQVIVTFSAPIADDLIDESVLPDDVTTVPQSEVEEENELAVDTPISPNSRETEGDGQTPSGLGPSPIPSPGVDKEEFLSHDGVTSPSKAEEESEADDDVTPSPEPVEEEGQHVESVIPSPKPTEEQHPSTQEPAEEEEREISGDVETSLKPEQEPESQPVVDEVHAPTSVSRSSSIRTLTPTPHAMHSVPIADEETEPAARPDVPVISLSPPPSAGCMVSPSVSSPQDFPSPQDSEQVHDGSSTQHSILSIGTRSQPVSPVGMAGNGPLSVQYLGTQRFRRFSELDVPANLGASFSNDSHSEDTARHDDSSMTDTPSEQVLQADSDSSTGAIPTSPLSVEAPESPARPAYDPLGRRASMPSPSSFVPPSTSTSLLGMFSPLSSGTNEVATTHGVTPVTDHEVSTFLPGSAGNYSLFPHTPDATNAEFKESLLSGALSPISPSSRFRDPPRSSGSRSTFRAVVHGKTKQPVSSPPLFKHLTGPQTPQTQKTWQPGKFDPLSPNTGELTTLLQDTALLEDALMLGDLFEKLPQIKPLSEASKSTEQIVTKPSEKQVMDKEGQQSQRRQMTRSEQFGEEGDPTLLKLRHTFHLPLRKKTKHWKASSTHAVLKDDLRYRPSLEAERSAGLSIPDPTFLQMDPAAKVEDTSGGSKSPRPRLLSGIKKLTSSGSTKALHAPGSYPRHSVSTSSELSSEDSMPVVTPDQSADFLHSDSREGTLSDSGQSYGSGVPWPSLSPKRGGIARAASFAEKIWNRARTKSGGSTLSGSDSRDRNASDAQYVPFPAAKGSSSNLTTATPSLSSQENLSSSLYKLDILPPSEPLFDARSFDDSDILSPASLPNPYSPASPSDALSPANGTRSPSMSVLTNPHSPRPASDNESWLSEASQIDPELFDAFPSVPQVVPSSQERRTQLLPSINVIGMPDPFFGDSTGPQSATLPKRTTTLPPLSIPPHSAAAPSDAGFLARASTMPRQRPSMEHNSNRS